MLSQLFLIFVPLSLAALNISVQRGEQIIKIPVTNSSTETEVCVIPKKYPNAIYSDRDITTEQQLCSLGGLEPVALCPKLVSTNPAVEFYSLPPGMTKEQAEAQGCKLKNSKKLAKYKGSISCSYTPSLLSYYQVSRILGNIGQVPPVVIRTLDLQTHKKIAVKANVLLVNSKANLLKKNWSGLLTNLNAGAGSSKKETLFTSDFVQSYGALQENPRNEEKYSEMFFSAKAGETRADAFRNRSPIFALLKNKNPLSSLVGNQFTASNVQRVLQMQNVADMIVMDTLLNQQDRFGNIHFTNSFFYLDSSEGLKVKSENIMTEEEILRTGAVQVKNMMLKDNDCGIAKENVAKKARLIQNLSHMNPETYARLLKLQMETSQESTKRFFMNETLMTEKDYSSFQQNLGEVVQTLKKACHEGRLQLDLDLNGHFANNAVNQSCD
ncbi:MAG: hypothetical protein ACXWRE_13730 [Pseudobdellovibrionaceae bacterium]